MGKKRKRPVKDDPTRRPKPSKLPIKVPLIPYSKPNDSDAVKTSHPVISQYYCQVVTLRQYILQRIPISSKGRRRRIAGIRSDDTHLGTNEECLAHLLDTTLVGVWTELPLAQSEERRRDFIAYTQNQKTQIGTDTGPASPQSALVDYVISSLFAHQGHTYRRTEHLLTHGFQEAGGFPHGNLQPCSILGVEAKFPNRNVEKLKQAPWTDVLGLLGNSGDDIMIKLLLDCGIFIPIDVKKGVYYQLSGRALSALDPIQTSKVTSPPLTKCTHPSLAGAKSNTSSKAVNEISKKRNPSTVFFSVRQTCYARPRLDPKGRIEFGMPNHVLNRCPSSSVLRQTVHVMKYIFPGQFGLRGVLTSDPKSRKDNRNESREDEIARQNRSKQARRTPDDSKTLESVPKRLRDSAVELVRRLQNRNRRCSYKELLRYYCPEQDACPWTMELPDTDEASYTASTSSSSAPLITQKAAVTRHDVRHIPQVINAQTSTQNTKAEQRANLTDYATPVASVSAFCKAVIQNLVPLEFFGTGEQGYAHQEIILGHVDRFTRLRRFENLSLDDICRSIRITQIPWLMPPNLKPASSQHKISLSDLKKRKEIFFEFIYYLFTSILIPLIRGNFYVTESQLHRNRLFYFRHDVWRRITTRPLANIKSSMFEELNIDEAKKILSNRKLGYGSLRLLPKSTSIRPILNLKLRPIMTTARAGRRQQKLGYSVNSTIAPIHGMLDFERRRRDHLLGSGINSVGDIHLRLKAFKESLVAKGWNKDTPLYFVKVDIQSCFDTIPQQNLVRLVETLIPEETYHYVNYVTVRPGNEFASMWPQGSDKCKTLRRFLGRATATSEHLTDSIANGSVPGRRNTVFVDTVKQHKHSSAALLDLLDAHVRSNLVRIGKKYFRQRNGIPQGSVISSLLCNLFYAEMERDVLGFLQPDNATVLLLRLIDDFLLVTPDSEVAMRFLRVMLKGQPAYGISVNPAKSLVNFAASIDGAQIPRLVDTTLFPYCGSLVDTQTLEIFKDQDRILDGAESVTAALTNSLSIEPSRAPGRSFHRKALASIKLTMHPMYLDTAHNSQSAVLSNLYSTMVTAAMKMYRYTRSLPNLAHPRPEVVVRTIHDVIQLGYRMVRGQHGLCAATIQYLGAAAFHLVLGRKQTRYASVLCWLDGMTEEARQSLAGNGVLLLLAQVVRKGNVTYGGWRF